jgi:hypothetical protein
LPKTASMPGVGFCVCLDTAIGLFVVVVVVVVVVAVAAVVVVILDEVGL